MTLLGRVSNGYCRLIQAEYYHVMFNLDKISLKEFDFNEVAFVLGNCH